MKDLLTRAKELRLKHGSHDQSTHGRGGGGDAPKAKRPRAAIRPGAGAAKPASGEESDWGGFQDSVNHRGVTTWSLPAGKTVFVKSGYENSGDSWQGDGRGSAQYQQTTYKPMTTKKGDKPIVNPGGMWYRAKGSYVAQEVQFKKPTKRSIYEHSYGTPDDRLMPSGLTREANQDVRYDTT